MASSEYGTHTQDIVVDEEHPLADDAPPPAWLRKAHRTTSGADRRQRHLEPLGIVRRLLPSHWIEVARSESLRATASTARELGRERVILGLLMRVERQE